MSLAFEHIRIEIPNSAVAPDLFGDYYRCGSRTSGARPLICCWGGAIYPRDYEERRAVTPDRLLEEFEPVLGGDDARDFDLVVLPNPSPEPRTRDQLRMDIGRTFVHDLLPRTPNPMPESIGFLGYSAGACVVTGLALDLPAARAVGVMGGVGMADAILDSRSAPRPSLRFAAFINADDPLSDETDELQKVLTGLGSPIEIHRGPGGHDIEDYLASGLVRAAGLWMKGALL